MEKSIAASAPAVTTAFNSVYQLSPYSSRKLFRIIAVVDTPARPCNNRLCSADI